MSVSSTHEEKEENFQRIERRYGSFVRSFTLPNTVDVENIEAEAADGVLSISLAKKPEAKPKQIEVKVGAAGRRGAAAGGSAGGVRGRWRMSVKRGRAETSCPVFTVAAKPAVSKARLTS